MRDWSGYFWHRTSHRELMATPEFAALKAESVGVLFYLRLLAGMSRQEHGADDGNDGNEEKAKQGHDKLPINYGNLIPNCSDCYNIYFQVW